MRCETVIPSSIRLSCRSPKKTSWGSTRTLSVYARRQANMQRDVRDPSVFQIGLDEHDSPTNPGLSATRNTTLDSSCG
jgi:hypothetical protein